MPRGSVGAHAEIRVRSDSGTDEMVTVKVTTGVHLLPFVVNMIFGKKCLRSKKKIQMKQGRELNKKALEQVLRILVGRRQQPGMDKAGRD